MKKSAVILVFAALSLVLLQASSFAEDHFETIFVKAPVSIGDIGIQNLVVGISFQPVSPDETLLESAEFKNFTNTIRIEIQGAAMQEILRHPYLVLDEMAALSQSIQERISELISARISETFPERPLTIPVSIARVEFYSTERTTLSIKQDDN